MKWDGNNCHSFTTALYTISEVWLISLYNGLLQPITPLIFDNLLLDQRGTFTIYKESFRFIHYILQESRIFFLSNWLWNKECKRCLLSIIRVHGNDVTYNTWSYTGTLNRHPAQASCTGILHRHPAQASCTGILYRHPVQASCTSILH